MNLAFIVTMLVAIYILQAVLLLKDVIKKEGSVVKVTWNLLFRSGQGKCSK